jgi:hypothetical protein
MMVGILDDKFCVNAKTWKGSYESYKVYLGRDRVLESPTFVSLEIEFRNAGEELEFFTFWAEKTNYGAKPFYVQTGLYGVYKHYLVSLVGSLDHTKRKLGVSGKFELYRTRTLDENIAPEIDNQSFSVDMDSTSNYMHIIATDYDALTYSIVTAPTNGNVALVEGGVVYYTPDDSFSGTDTFVVRVTDELDVYTEATVSVNVIDWKANEQFKLTMDANGHLYIDYVNPSTLDPLVVQAVDELSLGSINSNGEYTIDVTQTQHIDNITKTGESEWLITPK